jgi:hypothetical protein
VREEGRKEGNKEGKEGGKKRRREGDNLDDCYNMDKP